MASKFVCGHCGKEHPGLPVDFGFRLPDEVHALSYLDRYRRTRHNEDLCTLDGRRYFIRTVLPLPLIDESTESTFNWGVWVEVDKRTHGLYLRGWTEDISHSPRHHGLLSNRIRTYPRSIGLPVEIEFQHGSARPLAWMPSRAQNAIALEQRRGITGKRHHDMLVELGYFRE